LGGQIIEKFSDRVQKLVKTSLTLQHLDLSSLNLDENQIKTFITRGVRKAKSLLSFHLSGNNISVDTVIFIRE
jgi:dTDP-4-amino-4,6-dideoxygalactose transaminase